MKLLVEPRRDRIDAITTWLPRLPLAIAGFGWAEVARFVTVLGRGPASR